MARQGNTPHSVTKFREATADGRKFVKEVGGGAPQAGPGKVQAARKAHHGRLANPADKQWIGTDETPWQGNQPHTAEYAGPGQCESTGSRTGNVPAVSADIDAAPDRHTVGGKVLKTSKDTEPIRKNGQQN